MGEKGDLSGLRSLLLTRGKTDVGLFTTPNHETGELRLDMGIFDSLSLTFALSFRPMLLLLSYLFVL